MSLNEWTFLSCLAVLGNPGENLGDPINILNLHPGDVELSWCIYAEMSVIILTSTSLGLDFHQIPAHIEHCISCRISQQYVIRRTLRMLAVYTDGRQ